jgi:hypothetical protein
MPTHVVPETVKAALEPVALAALETALAPPAAQRASATIEVELEAEGEGVFTLVYKDWSVTAKKGFAKKPLLSARLGRGSWALLRDQLQAAVDGFPAAPLLQSRLHAWRGLGTTDFDAVVVAVAKVTEGASIRFDVKGAGTMVVARGPVDEATKELVVVVDAQRMRGLLTGAPLSSIQASLQGDRSVGTAVVAALGPILAKLKL